jgi:hypothetical protein
VVDVAEQVGVLLDLLGPQLAVLGRDRDELAAGEPLGRAALVDVDVRGLGADDRLVGREQALQADDVGARAAPREHDGRRHAEDVVDLTDGPLGPGVGPVGQRVAGVGPGDGLEHRRVHPRRVVAGERAGGGGRERTRRGGHGVTLRVRHRGLC